MAKSQRRGYVVYLFIGKFSVHRQGEHLAGEHFSHGERAFLIAKVSVSLL